MERKYLERCLADGMSLKAIGQEVGKHPTTVAYWLGKHGLVAAGSERYAPKGPLPRDQLQTLIDDGHSLREMARILGTGLMQVRYWVKKHGLEPARAVRQREIAAAMAEGRQEVELVCRRHGRTLFKIIDGTRVRCRRCNSEGVSSRRRKVKEILVREAGGSCAICGYDKHPRALEFHHVDPSQKSFGIGRGFTRSLEETRREAAKCILLCSNCHVEVEEGLVDLPAGLREPVLPTLESAPRG
jgi:transposase